MMSFEMRDVVRDRETGIEGRVVGSSIGMVRVARYQVQPLDGGEPSEIDEEQLELVERPQPT
jgi:hypothetical protein